MQYQVKAVIFDLLAECKELKEELLCADIQVGAPFLGLRAEEALQQETRHLGVAGEDCLFITNSEQHAKVATRCGMVVIGCMEGHFEIPKTTTLLASPEEVTVGYLDRVYCHEKKIPAVILETPRLFLKELTGQDMDILYEILTEEEVSRYLPAKTGTREEELEKLISYISCVYSFFEYGYWGVFLKETGKLIGRAGFREGSYPPEVGYVIQHSLWGRGYATEVLRSLSEYAAEEFGYTQILAKIDARNTASIRVAEKCGFVCKPPENSVLSEEGKNVVSFIFDM